MPKQRGDMSKAPAKSMGQIGRELASGVARKDERYNRFWNYVPIPKLMQDDGFYGTQKKVKAVFGANRSTKTTACCFETVMAFTGIIPPAMQGLYAWEQVLRDLVVGPNRRPRYCRIIVMDYSEHWPMVIRPMLLDSASGMLPEAWSDFDNAEHSFTGPDGSVLDIFSADPDENTDPRKLRGAPIDHSWIDEINRRTVYTESVVRGAAHSDGPATVSLSYCPQEGWEHWTKEEFHDAAYVRKGEKSFPLPADECHPDIYAISVNMKDNPSITAESYERQKRLFRPWERAFRVDGQYSSRTSDNYFHAELLIDWEDQERTSIGRPMIVVERNVDCETGRFEAVLGGVDDDLIQAGGEFDEVVNPVWRVWEEPIEDEKYVITADCAEGNPKSDFQAASVWKCTEPTKPVQVASLHIRTLKPGSFGIQCACMAYCYGNCLLVPEANGPGLVFIDRVRLYSNMYFRSVLDTQTEQVTKKLGWSTNKHSKPVMLDVTHKMLMKMSVMKIENGFDEEGLPVYRNHCPFKSRDTLSEFLSYEEKIERDKKTNVGKTTYGARRGTYDDEVIQTCIAFRVMEHEFSRITACKVPKPMVSPKKNLHYLGEQQTKRNRPFEKMRKQPNLETLRKQHGRR